ncbi:MAG: HAD-IC family P-type ATPase [Limnobacter sp.]|nr:HAD-IC family P-type ATPase [Limnobacter sp.]
MESQPPQVPVVPIAQNLLACQSRRGDGLWEGTAWVQGITCAACAVELEQEARHISGLQQFELNPASALGHWVASNPEAIEQLNRKAQQLGYLLDTNSGSGSELSLKKDKQHRKGMLLRLIVAVLCMMQIMMYSAPEYIYAPEQIGWVETQLLRWAQWVLCWPVLLYSAQSIFRSAWVASRNARWSVELPVSLGLVIAFVYSSVQMPNPQAKMWFDCVAMLVALLLTSRWLVSRYASVALNHVMALEPDLPSEVSKWDGRAWVVSPIAAVQRGDLIKLKAGETCAVEMMLEPGCGDVWVDESMRTGESQPVLRKAGDVLEAGAKLVGGATGKVMSMKAEGYLSRIGESLQRALASKPSRQASVDRLIPYFSMAVVLAAALAGGYWGVVRNESQLAWSATVSVLLVSCPCALALSWPLVRLFAIQKLSGLGVLVRNAEALDRLADVDCMALDKTGTLSSRHELTVRIESMKPLPGLEAEQPPLTLNEAKQVVLLLAQRNHHPLSSAISRELILNLSQHSDNPFEVLSYLEIAGQGVSAVVLNSLTGEHHLVRLGSAGFCQVQVEEENSQASWVYLAVGGEHLQPLLKAEIIHGNALIAPSQFQALLPYRPSLLSGDKQSAVQAWATELEFAERRFEQTPQDKAQWIRNQQADGRHVLMFGDGLNDAVAFAQADVSVASYAPAGLTAKQADFLMLREQPSLLVDLMLTARRMKKLGFQNMAWSLIYNLLALPLAMAGQLEPWMAALGMGVSSLVVIANSARLNTNSKKG